MIVWDLISSHRPPELQPKMIPSHPHVKADLSENQKQFLLAAGESGLKFTHQSNLLTRLSSGLQQACMETDLPGHIISHWRHTLSDHERYHRSSTVHNEIYLLHPVFDHQLFQLVQFLTTHHLDELFKPDFRPVALESLSWRRYRHVNATINSGMADAMLMDGARQLLAIMEIKFPASPTENGADLEDCFALIRKAKSDGGFHLRIRQKPVVRVEAQEARPVEHELVMSTGVTTIMGSHLLQVSPPLHLLLREIWTRAMKLRNWLNGNRN